MTTSTKSKAYQRTPTAEQISGICRKSEWYALIKVVEVGVPFPIICIFVVINLLTFAVICNFLTDCSMVFPIAWVPPHILLYLNNVMNLWVKEWGFYEVKIREDPSSLYYECLYIPVCHHPAATDPSNIDCNQQCQFCPWTIFSHSIFQHKVGFSSWENQIQGTHNGL